MPLGVDLRARTTLLCGALALAIAASMLLRGRVRPVHLLFAGLAGDIGLIYLAQSLVQLAGVETAERVVGPLAVLLPLLAANLFESIIPRDPTTLSRLPSLSVA